MCHKSDVTGLCLSRDKSPDFCEVSQMSHFRHNEDVTGQLVNNEEKNIYIPYVTYYPPRTREKRENACVRSRVRCARVRAGGRAS